MAYKIVLHSEAKKALDCLDKAVKLQILKKLVQMEREDLKSRHLKKGLAYFVEEAGQYRICFSQEEKTRKVWFIGNHKQYRKWYLP